jgi:hypothetical protein
MLRYNVQIIFSADQIKDKGNKMMNKLMLLCAANLLAVLAFGADDVYYNNKTFSATESTDGNVYIGPSTASEEALVTVKNGATWNSAANIFLGSRERANFL